MRRRVGILLVALWVVACRRAEDAPAVGDGAAAEAPATGVTALAELSMTELVTADGSTAPNLIRGASEVPVLSWWEPLAGDEVALRWSRRDAGRWSEPATVVQGSRMFVNFADVPAVVATGGESMLAVWPQQRGDERGYGLQWSRTDDAGHRWRTPETLADDQDGPEYGFVSFAASSTGGLVAFYLDGRASSGHHGGQMQLRAVEFDAAGLIVGRRLVDDRVCDCCQTDADATLEGPVVVYRDRSEGEVRDIAVAGPGPDERRSVSPDGWKIEGCPVNGPAVAVRDRSVAVAWFSAAEDSPAVWVAFAPLHGDFGPRHRVDLGRPLGRVDLDWKDDDEVVVSFVDTVDEAPSVVVRSVALDGTMASPATVTRTLAARGGGFPRMRVLGDELVLAWTDAGPTQTRVKMAAAPLASLPGK